jgi:hypothetical protein
MHAVILILMLLFLTARRHFLISFATNARMTLHVDLIRGNCLLTARSYLLQPTQ